MKIYTILLMMALSLLTAATSAASSSLSFRNLSLQRGEGRVTVSVDFVLDGIKMGSNRQMYITPVISDSAGHTAYLPEVLVNGRNMQYAIERGTIKAESDKHPEVITMVRRKNGKPQTVSYTAGTEMKKWMYSTTARVGFAVDTCGCGRPLGTEDLPGEDLKLNPASEMLRAYITPSVTALPVEIHEGRARVQFEVDRTELHETPYRCANGKIIDNRAELKAIDDSIRYALSDPNVEIAEVEIIGYASPESPYTHNEQLATGRSRALAEYIGRRYSLPRESAIYDAVAENWKEFRDMVEKSDRLSEKQRTDLLSLIDEPAYGPADYDAKEKTLKTDPRFASLYRSLILPEWFPRLRATVFRIKTRLKPLSDEKLAEVMEQTPEKMSLNQMFRVARLSPEGSLEFDKAIETALRYYPDDPTANLNAAIKALNEEDIDKAEEYLKKAGDSAEAENARGIAATYRGDMEAASEHFRKATSPEARHNEQLLF